jgi:aminopeptidase N
MAPSRGRGLYFRTAALGYPEGDEHLWTQGQTHEARYWYPSIDYPNERFTSEVICRVPEGMIARSNGRLVGQSLGADGLVAWHWLQEPSHPNYLVALVAGRMGAVEGRHGEIPMAFWAPMSQVEHAARAFAETPSMMAFFEEEIGIAYPWAKYEQAVVWDYTYGGMENTTLTILHERALLPEVYENARENTGLVAHELAHQWFGNFVTCKDWSHTWLNEGFATYYAHLYLGRRDGRDAFRYNLWRKALGLSSRPGETTPLVRRDYERAFEQFSTLAYDKGAWVLHMLRRSWGMKCFGPASGCILSAMRLAASSRRT